MNSQPNPPTLLSEMLQYDLHSMGTTMASPTDSFLSELHDMSGFGGIDSSATTGYNNNASMRDSSSSSNNNNSATTSTTSTSIDAFDANDLAAKNNRNRGNYRCSKCGEPKKGHVCPLVPTNFKCARCGLPKKTCTCVAPVMRSIGVQVEMDADMTTRVLDLRLQGVIEFHKSVVGYPSPSSSTLS